MKRDFEPLGEDEEIDEDIEAAWAAEIDRRLAELDSGTVKSIPWAEAKRQLTGKRPAR